MILETKKKFEPHPETGGPIRAVIVDITEPVARENKFQPGKTVLKFAIVYETDIKQHDGTSWTHWAHGYTPSLNEKATLRKDIIKITGQTPTEKFDTESLIGKPVKLIIEHKHDGDETYANITYLKQDTASDALKPSGKYIRQRDKKKDENNTGSAYNRADGAQEESKQPWQQTKVHVGRSKGQEVENLDTASLEALINYWIPNTYDGYKAKPADPPYKVTADDKRLLFALGEAQKAMAAMSQPASDF